MCVCVVRRWCFIDQLIGSPVTPAKQLLPGQLPEAGRLQGKKEGQKGENEQPQVKQVTRLLVVAVLSAALTKGIK